MEFLSSVVDEEDQVDNSNAIPAGHEISANLARQALLEATDSNFKTIVDSMLSALTDDQIIYLCQTLLPDAKITIDKNPVIAEKAINAVNLKIETKNKKDAVAIAQNPNIVPLTPGSITTGLVKWAEVGVTGVVTPPLPISNDTKVIMNEE